MMLLSKFIETFRYHSLSDLNLAQLMLRNLDKDIPENKDARFLANELVQASKNFSSMLRNIGMQEGYGTDKNDLTTQPVYKSGLEISTGIEDLS